MSTRQGNNFVSNSNIFLHVFSSLFSGLIYNTSSNFLLNKFHKRKVKLTSCFAYSFTTEAGSLCMLVIGSFTVPPDHSNVFSCKSYLYFSSFK